MNATAPTRPVVERAPWKAAALPSEHGGWGLTLEPVLLGLLLSPSWAGLALGVAAMLAFLVRTPIKLALVDVHRERWLARSTLALRVAVVESVLLLTCAAVAVALAGWGWLVPVGVAVPLVAVELWFDVRSRGRRLVPELCGAAGIGAVVAAIVIAGGDGARLAVAAWMILAARALGAIPFVRVQIQRLHRGRGPVWQSDLAQCAAVAIGSAAMFLEHRVWAGAAGLLVLAAVQTWWVRRPPTPAKVLGLRQMALGFALVAATALGALAA